MNSLDLGRLHKAITSGGAKIQIILEITKKKGKFVCKCRKKFLYLQSELSITKIATIMKKLIFLFAILLLPMWW